MSKEKHHLFTILMTALAMMTVITAAVSLVLYLVPVYDLAIDYLDLSRKTGISARRIFFRRKRAPVP